MSTHSLFISDLHLSPERPRINQVFAEFAAGIEPDGDAVDAGAAQPCIGIKIGARIASDQTGPPHVAEAHVGTGEKAGKAALQGSGIAVRVRMPPAAEPLRPEGEIAACMRIALRALHRHRHAAAHVGGIGIIRIAG